MSDALEETARIQSRVADPKRSAWVSANAGTGKTYVLVRRVIRQLLEGAHPQAILCITYTKAAAAEMSDRLLGMLSDWALLPDDALDVAIQDVTGQMPSEAARERARRLFALSLESPGGLKIQTIHSFCSSLLSRFPVEASVPLAFQPLEDDQAAALMREAVAKTASAFAAKRALRAHIELLTDRFQADAELDGPQRSLTLEKLLQNYARYAKGMHFKVLDTAQLVSTLASKLGCQVDDTAQSLVDSCLMQLDQRWLRQLVILFSTAGVKAQNLAQGIEQAMAEPSTENLFDQPPWLTGKGQPRNIIRIGNIARQLENVEDKWAESCECILTFRSRWFALKALEANLAALLTSEAVLRTYTAEKEHRAALDYDDLIDKTIALLSSVPSAWVRYRLDRGIDHILLDEAQDNSSPQWEVFRKLAEDITSTDQLAAGEDQLRSIFIVGDPKQSIYSFQGAEAALFNTTRHDYEQQLGHRMASEQLYLSFRTAQPVLDVVNAAFDRDDFRMVSGDYHPHTSYFDKRFGSVELWPDLPSPEGIKRSVFDAAVDDIQEESIHRKLALQIAADIKQRLERGDRLACKNGAPVQPDDVMVLFQRRSGDRFTALLKALAELDVPSAGTDRIAVQKDQAVHDLRSLLRFAANTDDDLSLAELLKSPFFGWSEDDVFDLCHGRKQRVLWLELKRRSEAGDGLARQAFDARTALQTALDAGARRGPYALLATMLERGGETTGRQRLAQRLGNGYRDAVGALLDAALTYEEGEPRSIHGFLNHTEKLRAEIKRDPAGDGDAGVRVMTVHGAKGLEAPIVYLADADYLKKPSDIIRSDPIVLVKPQNLDFSVPILLPQSADQDSRETAALRLDEVDRHYEEYQRLLYVAATRAQESLIVCGGAKDKDGKTWHRLIGEGFDKLAASGAVVERVPSPEGAEGERLIYANKAALPDAEAAPQPVDPGPAIPDWLYQQAEPEAANPVIYPSLAGEDDDASDGRFVLAAPSSSDARKRGLLIHRLLELLPSRPEETWAEDAQHLVAPARQQLGDEECAEIVRAALDFLRNPQYKDLFSAESRAEVAIQGQIGKSTVSGVIDRLVVSPDLVTIAEFKTSRWIPASPSDIPEAHRRQAEIYGQLVSEIYPGRGVRSLLIYTTAPQVFDLSKDCVP